MGLQDGPGSPAARETVDALVNAPVYRPMDQRLLNSVQDPQQRKALELQPRGQRQELFSDLLARSLEGRPAGAGMTDVQAKLLSQIEDPQVRAMFQQKLGAR